MAFLKYRGSKPSAAWTVDATGNQLSNTDIDTNFYSLDSAKFEKAGGTISGNVTINGDLTITGTNTIINAATLNVDDKNIELGAVDTPTDTTANGGGITLLGATNKTIIWDSTNSNWTSSENWNLPTGKSFKINNVEVLSSSKIFQLPYSSWYPNSVAISSYDRTNNVVTIVTTGAHNFAVNDQVSVMYENTMGDFWGAIDVTITAVPNSTTFKYSQTGIAASSGAGGYVTKGFQTSFVLRDSQNDIRLGRYIYGQYFIGQWGGVTIPALKGGTGQSGYATGDLLYASSTTALSKLAKPSAVGFLKMDANGTPSWDTTVYTVPNNGTITFSAGAGLDIGTTTSFTTNQSAAATITFSHKDTSSQANVANTGNSVIQSVEVDTYGHVTSLSSTTITKVDGATKHWSTSHPDQFYNTVAWDGTYWNITNNHGSGVRVARADSATDSTKVPLSGQSTITVSSNLAFPSYTYTTNFSNDSSNTAAIRIAGTTGSVNLLSANGKAVISPSDSKTVIVGSLKISSANTDVGTTEYTVWHENNDGHNSGLDADLLDGNHASAFATSGHTHTSLALTSITAACSADALYVPVWKWLAIGPLQGGQSVVLRKGTDDDVSYAWGVAPAASSNTYVQNDFNSYATRFVTGLTQGLAGRSHSFQRSNQYSSVDSITWVDLFYIKHDGSVWAKGDVVAYSDLRVKNNVKTIDNALNKVEQLRGVTYERTDIDNKKSLGVIAQEVREVLPELVTEDQDGMLSVAYGNMVGVLIEAIKELNAKVEDLQKQIANK